MNIQFLPGTRPEEALVVIEGDWDLYSSPEIGRLLLAKVQAGTPHLVLDMAQVTYLDSSGVGVIIRVLQAVRIRQGSVSTLRLQGAPRKVLAMSNILSLLKEVDTRWPPS